MKTFAYMIKSVVLTLIVLGATIQTGRAACSVGQVEVVIEVVTDIYGYECYWELVPNGNTCGTGTIFSGGSTTVGCGGGCVKAQDTAQGYASSVTIVEGPWCLPLATSYDIVFVDDWGDGGTTFNVYMSGVLTNTFIANTTGICGETFTFTTAPPPDNNLTLNSGFYRTSSDSSYMRFYTEIPQQQAQSTSLTFGGGVKNNGALSQSNTALSANVTGALTYSGSSSSITLLPSVEAMLDVTTTFTPSAIGTYNVTFDASSSAIDDVPGDNTITESFMVVDTTYARDNGVISGSFWYNATTLYHLGQNFEIFTTDTATSISFYLGTLYSSGDVISYHIWNEARTSILYSANNHVITAGEVDSWLTLGFDGGPVALSPATYFVAIETFGDSSTFQIDGTDAPLGASYGDPDKNGIWFASTRTILLRLNLGLQTGGGGGCAMTSSALGTSISCNGGSDGSAMVSASGGTGPFTYAWSPGGGTSATINGLSVAGTYSVTVTDAAACITTATAVVSEPSALTVSASGNDPGSCGAADGAVVANTFGGTAPYTYLWDDPGSQTNMMATGLAAGTYTVIVIDNNGCTESASATISDPGGPVLSATSIDPTCGLSNGTATVFVFGGSIPYTYTWSSGGNGTMESNLGAGTYTVLVTDASGCTATISTTLIAGSTPAVIVSGTDPTSCGSTDGTATAFANAGTTPYTYSWNSGGTGVTQSNLGAGVYTVTVTDANGCTATSSTTLTSGSAPTVFIFGIDPSSCGTTDGTVSASATGGTSPFTYAWSSGGNVATESNLGAGIYTVTVTDAIGCTATASFTLTSPGAPTISTNGTDPTSCGLANGSATVAVAGGTTPYTYTWSSGGNTANESNLGAGTYTVTVTDASGCTAVSSTILTAGAAPTVSTSSTNPTSCGSTDGTATAMVTGGTMPYTYAWSSGGNAVTEGNLAAGTYTVTVTDAGGCSASSSVALTSGSAPTVNATSTNPTSCGSTDGTAFANTTGGTTPYTYAWSSGGNTATETNLGAGLYTVTVTDASGCTAISSTTLTSSGAPTLITASTDANCTASDGTGSVFPSGGTSPYSYMWSNGQSVAIATSLAAGTYTVSVTDNSGCVAVTSVTVTSSGTGPTLSFITSDLNCYDDGSGSAAVSAAGGASPYTYGWSSGNNNSIVTGMDAGNYNVTVTDNDGCQTIQSIILTEPSEIVSTSTVTDASCGVSDGFALLTSVGGVPPYSYQWDAAAGNQTGATGTNLSAGTYAVTITDGNGCGILSQVNVSNIGAPSLTLVPSDAICFSTNTGSITSVANGGNGAYTYSWSNGSSGVNLSNVTAGTYTLTLTDTTGCVAIQSAVINEPNVLYGTTSWGNVSSSTTCDGQASVSSFGGTGGYSYVWDDPATQNTATAFGLCLGTYNVTVTDANGCSFTSSVYVDSIAMGITPIKTVQLIDVYPNPTVNTVTISWDMPSEEAVIVRIIGLDGKEVHAATITQNAAYLHKVELTGYSKGLYFIQVVTSNQVIVEKLIVH